MAVVDTFSRTVASGWGTTDSGHTWVGTHADHSVSGGRGRINTAGTPPQNRSMYLEYAHDDVELMCDVGSVQVQTGTNHPTAYLWLRCNTANTEYYRLGFSFAFNGTLTVNLQKTGGIVLASNFYTSPYTAGQMFRARFRVRGSTISAKVWPVGTAEPQAWQASVTDTAVVSGTRIIAQVYRNAGSTTPDPTILFDNLLLADLDPPSAANFSPEVPILAPNSRFRLETRTKFGDLVSILPHLNLVCYFHLNKPDTLTVEIPMWDSHVTPENIKEVEHELWLWKLYPGETPSERLVFAGPIWTISVNSSDRKLKLDAEGLLSYFQKRTIDWDFAWNGFFNPWTLARSIVQASQVGVFENLNIGLGNNPSTTAYSVSGKFYRYEQRKVSEVLDDFATQRGFIPGIGDTIGYDFQVMPATRNFEVWAPRKGKERNITLTYGGGAGSISNYSVQIFGKYVVTNVTAQGPGEGEKMILSTQENYVARQRYGRMQSPISYKDAITQASLDALTLDYLATRSTAKRYPQFSLRDGRVDMFNGTFDIGDTVRIVIDDQYIRINKLIRTNGFGLFIGSEDQETIVLYTEDDNLTAEE